MPMSCCIQPIIKDFVNQKQKRLVKTNFFDEKDWYSVHSCVIL